MSDFQFADLGKVAWPATIKLALARGFFSGLMIAIIQNIVLSDQAGAASAFLIVPLGMAVLAIPIGLLCLLVGKVASLFVPALGLFFRAIGALAVCLGDPLVYLLHRQFPDLFDIADFRFFNFTPLIFITDPE